MPISKYSKTIQVTLKGKLLKDFISEVARAEEGEASVGRELIRYALETKHNIRHGKGKPVNIEWRG